MGVISNLKSIDPILCLFVPRQAGTDDLAVGIACDHLWQSSKEHILMHGTRAHPARVHQPNACFRQPIAIYVKSWGIFNFLEGYSARAGHDKCGGDRVQPQGLRQAHVSQGVGGESIGTVQAAPCEHAHQPGTPGMQGEIIAPGSHQAGDTLWGIAGEHAFKRDAQCMHQVRFELVQQFAISLCMAQQRQWTENVAQGLKKRTESTYQRN